MINQGYHSIELSFWFLGDFSEINGFAHTHYWNKTVDDNSFILLKVPKKQAAFLHG